MMNFKQDEMTYRNKWWDGNLIAIDPDEADSQDDQTEQLMFSMPNMLNNRHLMQKHWTYKKKAKVREDKPKEQNKCKLWRRWV